jgi:hypothetical protein
MGGRYRPEYAITNNPPVDSLLLSEQNYVKTTKRGVHFFREQTIVMKHNIEVKNYDQIYGKTN